MMRNRRAALEGLSRILDAGAPEELFTGAEEEATFLHELLVETARARSSSYYWEVCRMARRRGVTPEYVVDRAVVLLAAMKERRRMDLYRILEVPPLSSGETIRQRWLEVAKQHHPDVGGDGAHFRHAKQAYEVLRDPVRRAEYERFWVRALGPFERVAPVAGPEPPERIAASLPLVSAPVEDAESVHRAVPPAASAADAPAVAPDRLRGALEEAARLLAARRSLDQRVAAAGATGGGGIGGLLARLEGALAPIPDQELARLSAEVTRVIAQLEPLRDRLAALAALKRGLRA
jgi:hypothetical protein